MDPHPLSSVSLWICRQWLHLPSHNFPPQWIYTSLLHLLIYATLSKLIIFVTLPGASFNPLWLWGWVEDSINSASCLLPVTCPVMKGWGLALFSFLNIICLPEYLRLYPPERFCYMQRQTNTHTHVSADLHTYFICFLYTFILYII